MPLVLSFTRILFVRKKNPMIFPSQKVIFAAEALHRMLFTVISHISLITAPMPLQFSPARAACTGRLHAPPALSLLRGETLLCALPPRLLQVYLPGLQPNQLPPALGFGCTPLALCSYAKYILGPDGQERGGITAELKNSGSNPVTVVFLQVILGSLPAHTAVHWRPCFMGIKYDTHRHLFQFPLTGGSINQLDMFTYCWCENLKV